MTWTAGKLEASLAQDFEGLRLAGEGATGTVYIAREPALRRLVAIKVPRPELARDPVVRGRFEREARAAARLRHPGIAAIHRIIALTDGTPCLVMEYVDGRTLDDVLRSEGPFQEGPGLSILVQVAAALAEAHRHGVIHRDVRPGNVIWDEAADRAVLTDFGIAGILETGTEAVTRLTRPGEPLGDPAYRAPEQIMGDPATPGADIYGWGLLAFEVLTGQRAFRAETPEGLASAHLRQPPRSLLDLAPGLDPGLAGLVDRCLAKDPRRRPAATAVARSIGEIKRRDGSRSVPPGPFNQPATHLRAVPALAGFLGELRRRRVYNVALAYAAIAFVALQGAGLILPALPLPDWAYPLVVAATLAGFPVAMVLAWMYDLTDAGVRRAEKVTGSAPGPMQWIMPALGLLLSLVLAAFIGWWVLAAG